MIMKKTVILLLVFLLTFSLLRAEFEDYPAGARAIGMGNAFTAVSNDATGLNFNPAGLIHLKNLQLVTMHEKMYNISELKRDYVAVAQPLIEKLDAVVGASWHRFGTTALYKETTFTVGIGKRLSERISIGVGLNTYDQAIVNTPNAHGFGLDVGLLFMPFDKLRIGLVAKNVNNPEVSEELKQISKIGIAIIPNEKILFSLDATKATGEDISWHLGQEYWMSENFVIRGGFENDPMSFTAGLGIRAFNWQLDYAFHSHEVMNLTHSISMSFDFSSIPIRIPGFKWYDKASYRKKAEKKKKDQVEEIIEIEEAGTEDKVKIIGGDAFYTTSMKKEVNRIVNAEGKVSGPVNINKADLKELMKIPGIGRGIGNNILIYRYLNGDIKSEQELMKVPKFTKNVWEKAKEYIRFE